MINSNVFYTELEITISPMFTGVFMRSHELADNGGSNRQHECKKRNSNRGWRITVVCIAANVAGLDHFPDATTGGNILCSTCYTAGTASVNASVIFDFLVTAVIRKPAHISVFDKRQERWQTVSAWITLQGVAFSEEQNNSNKHQKCLHFSASA